MKATRIVPPSQLKRWLGGTLGIGSANPEGVARIHLHEATHGQRVAVVPGDGYVVSHLATDGSRLIVDSSDYWTQRQARFGIYDLPLQRSWWRMIGTAT